jgi:hypothetical protein
MKAAGVSEGDPLTGEIIGAAIELRRFFGPGLLESSEVSSVRSVPRWFIFCFFYKRQ